MANTPDFASCGNGAEATLLPASPFMALQFHFGMLLGVDDFEVSQAYARGKMRLHNAWLHGDGVVWGFGVSFNARKELVVDPGLALDAAGHELHLDGQACVDVGKWYGLHKDKVGKWKKSQETEGVPAGADDATKVTFTAHVVARFKACLTRPVPAIADPCEGTSTDTAYSRAFETVELLLVPGAAERRPSPDLYHRLRLLFGLEGPRKDANGVVIADDQTVLDALANEILTLQAAEQPAKYLEFFRQFAALDTLDLEPQQAPAASIFPRDPSEVVLAEIRDIVVQQDASGEWTFVSAADPDVTVRRTLVATSTIQELLCGPLFTAPPDAPLPPPPDMPLGGGPRIDADSVGVEKKTITMTASSPLDPATVDDAAFSVTTFSADDGWNHVDVRKAAVDGAGTRVTLDLKEAPTGLLLRIIAYGTGSTPILGRDHVPLAGAVGGPAGSEMDGHDFVHMLEL